MNYAPSSPDFCFRPTAEGLAVCLGKSRIVHVVRDALHPTMFRVLTHDGRLSDMANKTRAKDAALVHAASILNAHQDTGISPSGASPMRSIGRRALREPKAA
jgi:hypothetical protein